MATIADVAERAGVSKTTVSHALSGKRPVAPATRARITQAIAELGFRPNALARGLRMQRTQLIALIIPDITNSYYSVLARGLQDALTEHGYHLYLCNTDGGSEQEYACIEDAIQRRVDGIVLSSHYYTHLETEHIAEHTIPSVVIGSPTRIWPHIDTITTDEQQGVKQAINYLIMQDHQRIGFINGPPDLPLSSAGLAGYRAALQDAQIPFDARLVVESNITRQEGAKAAHILLQHGEPAQRPSAIFCADDLLAIGVMDAARDSKLAVPGQLAIMGFGNIEAASLTIPTLSTVLNPAYEVGQTAGCLLLERLQDTDNYDKPGKQVIVPHKLILREST